MISILGPTGSGKNNWLSHYPLPLILAGTHSISCFFPHEAPAMQLIAQAYAILGDALIPRLIVERLRESGRVVMRSVVQKSRAAAFDQILANDLTLSWFLDMLAHNRPDFKNPSSRPVLYRYTTLCYRARQYSNTWWPDSWMPFVLEPRHPVQRLAIETCERPEVREELEEIATFSRRDQLSLLQPIANLIGPFASNAAMLARTSRPAWSRKIDRMRRKTVEITIGEGAGIEAQRMMHALDLEETMNAAVELNQPCIYVTDEMNKLGMTESYVNHMATKRVYGVTLISLQQYLKFEDPALQAGFLQNCDRRWMPQASNDMAELCALDMRGLLDPMKVHHQETTKRQFTRLEWMDRETVTKGDKGSSKSTSTQLVSVPYIEEEVRDVYESPRDQEFWNVRRIMESPVGTVFAKNRLEPGRMETMPLFRNGWGFDEVRLARYEEAVRKCQMKDVFEVPVANEFPRPASQTTNAGRGGRRRRSR